MKRREDRGSFGSIAVTPRGGVEWLLPSAQEMLELDRAAIAGGIPALHLMERAGAMVADAVMEEISPGQPVLIVCGPGNNGGDGLVVARLLNDRGVLAQCVVAQAERYSAEFLIQIQGIAAPLVLGEGSAQLREYAPHVLCISEADLEAICAQASVVVDALLGTGQSAAPREAIAGIISPIMRERLRRESLRIISIDVPTGVCCDTGAVYQPSILADRTVTIEVIKRGMLQFPGRAACGEIVAVPIGIIAEADSNPSVEFRAITGAALPRLASRRADVHKGELGRILVVGGSAAMPGAPVLAVLGALHCGAGVVSRVVRPAWNAASFPVECINVPLEGAAPSYTAADLPAVLSACERSDVVVLGPGIGIEPHVVEFVRGVLAGLQSLQRKVVIDADALTIIAQAGLDLSGIPAIITPHPGEASRLLRGWSGSLERDRFAAVRELWRRYGAVSLLKGAGTLTYGEGRGGVVPLGTPYLATAGSGDVLSGVIAACFHRCNSAFESASLGGYIHACAGIRASAHSGGPVLASEVAMHVSSVVGELER